MAEGRLVYGFHAVTARVKQRPESVREIYLDVARRDPRARVLTELAHARGIRVQHLTGERLDRMLRGVRHQGVVCSVAVEQRTPDLEEVLERSDTPPLLLALDGVQDPHNLGACLRSADAMGVHAVIAPKDRAVGITAVAEKVACGAAETVPYLMVTNLARTLDLLRERGIWIVGLDGEAEAVLASVPLTGGTTLVLGAEGGGLRRLTRERCDVLARIPMLGTVESLNVSVAAGICLYEAQRQRGRPEPQKA
jgi:23S rRNA (guanosine2251-2'-O)-methyltransferase